MISKLSPSAMQLPISTHCRCSSVWLPVVCVAIPASDWFLFPVRPMPQSELRRFGSSVSQLDATSAAATAALPAAAVVYPQELDLLPPAATTDTPPAAATASVTAAVAGSSSSAVSEAPSSVVATFPPHGTAPSSARQLGAPGLARGVAVTTSAVLPGAARVGLAADALMSVQVSEWVGGWIAIQRVGEALQ